MTKAELTAVLLKVYIFFNCDYIISQVINQHAFGSLALCRLSLICWNALFDSGVKIICNKDTNPNKFPLLSNQSMFFKICLPGLEGQLT